MLLITSRARHRANTPLARDAPGQERGDRGSSGNDPTPVEPPPGVPPWIRPSPTRRPRRMRARGMDVDPRRRRPRPGMQTWWRQPSGGRRHVVTRGPNALGDMAALRDAIDAIAQAGVVEEQWAYAQEYEWDQASGGSAARPPATWRPSARGAARCLPCVRARMTHRALMAQENTLPCTFRYRLRARIGRFMTGRERFGISCADDVWNPSQRIAEAVGGGPVPSPYAGCVPRAPPPASCLLLMNVSTTYHRSCILLAICLTRGGSEES